MQIEVQNGIVGILEFRPLLLYPCSWNQNLCLFFASWEAGFLSHPGQKRPASHTCPSFRTFWRSSGLELDGSKGKGYSRQSRMLAGMMASLHLSSRAHAAEALGMGRAAKLCNRLFLFIPTKKLFKSKARCTYVASFIFWFASSMTLDRLSFNRKAEGLHL